MIQVGFVKGQGTSLDLVVSAAALRQTCSLLSGDLRFERIGMAAITTVIAGGFLVTDLCEMGELEEASLRLAETMTSAETSLLPPCA